MRRREPHATVLGAEIDGDRGRVSAPRERVALLSFIACIVIATHVVLFRRPVFSLLDAVYHEGENLPPDAVFRMSSQCSHELMLLCILSPVIQTDIRVKFAPELFMMDASPSGGGICRAQFSSAGAEELWRHTEQRGYYTRLQGANLALHELGLDHTECFGGPDSFFFELPAVSPLEAEPLQLSEFQQYVDSSLKDSTVVYDCIELFSGQGNWSRQHGLVGFRMHPGVERDAIGVGFGDLSDDDTFRSLARLAYNGCIRDWPAGPPCWSFHTLRRPRLRSSSSLLVSIRTTFLLTLALLQYGILVVVKL